MAGYVAVLLSIPDPDLPFNEPGISGTEFVTRVRDYLRNEKSWTSPGGTRNLRNQITQRGRDSAVVDLFVSGYPDDSSDSEGGIEN